MKTERWSRNKQEIRIQLGGEKLPVMVTIGGGWINVRTWVSNVMGTSIDDMGDCQKNVYYNLKLKF